MEDMKRRNPAKARVYYYGEYGVDSEGLVIKNWREEPIDALELAASGLERRAGMDLGFVDKTAIIDSLIDSLIDSFYDRQNHII